MNFIQKYIGEIEIQSGLLNITDPIYEHPEITIPVINGEWIVTVLNIKDKINKTIELHLTNKEYISIVYCNSPNEKISVDSGLINFYDTKCQNNKNEYYQEIFNKCTNKSFNIENNILTYRVYQPRKLYDLNFALHDDKVTGIKINLK